MIVTLSRQQCHVSTVPVCKVNCILITLQYCGYTIIHLLLQVCFGGVKDVFITNEVSRKQNYDDKTLSKPDSYFKYFKKGYLKY